ncbi:MAG: tyrosine-type recombinase/integrase [Desulfomonilia bacterium]|jgi:integrase|nr:site-specific integrase [Pseudomonadota bacterium]
MGCIYKRGKIYWIKYYKNGKPYQESTKSGKEAEAKNLLKKREGEIAEGKFPGIVFGKVKFDDLAKDLLSDYRINGKKSLDRVEYSIKHLKKHFKGVRIPEITTPRINKYIEARLQEGAENGTINRELAALKRMMNIGAKQTPPRVDRVPYIPMLKENNVRKGFFEHVDFIALRDTLPHFLKGFVTFGYKTGWRKSEIETLTWSQVDREQGIVRLEPGDTKNDDGRTVYLDSELQEVFKAQWEKRKAAKKILPYVFPNEDGTDRIKDFRGSWDKACKEAKIGKRLFHDMRRTAVRNMVRSGIPERVAMMISGHKTRTVFDRYNIVNADDLKRAAAKQEAYLESQAVTKTVTTVDFSQKADSANTDKSLALSR